MTKKLNDILGSAREQINELSRKTLGSYTKKAVTDLAARSVNLGLNVTHSTSNKLEGKPTEYQDKNIQHNTVKMSKRLTGISRSLDKLAKEEVEPIDELSKKTLGSYALNASDEKDKAHKLRSYNREVGYRERMGSKKFQDAFDRAEKYEKTIDKRYRGLKTAIKKLSGSAKVNASEEVEPIDELSRKSLAEAKAVDLKSQAKELSNKIDSIVLKGGKVDYNDPLNVKLSNLRKKIAATKKK